MDKRETLLGMIDVHMSALENIIDQLREQYKLEVEIALRKGLYEVIQKRIK